MTGHEWLARLMGREADPGKRRRAMERRIRDVVARMTPAEARATLLSFRRDGSQSWQVATIGCWSQSLDARARQRLGLRIR